MGGRSRQRRPSPGSGIVHVVPELFGQHLGVQGDPGPPLVGLCPLKEVLPRRSLDCVGSRPPPHVVAVLGAFQLELMLPVLLLGLALLDELQVLWSTDTGRGRKGGGGIFTSRSQQQRRSQIDISTTFCMAKQGTSITAIRAAPDLQNGLVLTPPGLDARFGLPLLLLLHQISNMRSLVRSRQDESVQQCSWCI